LVLPRPPLSTLFPYTTLFRSAAALGPARAAFWHLRRARRGLSARLHQRRVFPDRPGHAARPRGEKRDPDRAVRRTEGARGIVSEIGRASCRERGEDWVDDECL